MNDYVQRKQNELMFLARFAGNVLCDDKNLLSTEIKRQALKERNLRMSNTSSDVFVFGKNSLEFTYLRCHHNYSIFNQYGLIGLQKTERKNLKTLFFNSGMSAITALVESILSIGNISIKYDNDIYFETYSLLQSQKQCGSNYLIYYDSISPSFQIDKIKRVLIDDNALGFILDTTCLHNENIDSLIDMALEHDKIVYLVKSLTKIDMLATEYSRMGCLTMICPECIHAIQAEVFDEIHASVLEKINNYNCTPAPIDFPPFWDYEEFFELNSLRINQIRNNCRGLYDLISKNDDIKIKVIKPNHELFLLFFPTKMQSKDELTALCKKIAYELGKTYNVKYCDSFGFDFISLDPYIDLISDRLTIRLSLNDYDKNTLDMFYHDLLTMLGNL